MHESGFSVPNSNNFTAIPLYFVIVFDTAEVFFVPWDEFFYLLLISACVLCYQLTLSLL